MMKRTFVVTCLLAWAVISALAQSTRQPYLVREGVVWHYACYEFETRPDGTVIDSTCTITEQKMQFAGDTIICGIDYKKCYRYATDHLAPHDSPVALAREQDGKVYFASLPQSDSCERPFMTLPGTFESLTHEYQVYDFLNVYAFVGQLDLHYKVQFDTIYVTGVTKVAVGDSLANAYELNINARYIEGVGIVGPNVGFLDNPFQRCSTGPSLNHAVLGLIMLTDLDGNVLYENNEGCGARRFDLNHDGRVDIADINIMINVMLGYDVPTGHQGHDTAPPLQPRWQFDVTGDMVVDISDVNTIVNALLGR